MVNKCLSCTIMTGMLIAGATYMFYHYGPGAGFTMLACLVLVWCISGHATSNRRNLQ